VFGIFTVRCNARIASAVLAIARSTVQSVLGDLIYDQHDLLR